MGVGKPQASNFTLDAARQRAVNAATHERPPVESNKQNANKSASNNNNKQQAPPNKAPYSYKDKMKADIPKQTSTNNNRSQKAKQ